MKFGTAGRVIVVFFGVLLAASTGAKAGHGGEPRLEVSSGEPDASPAYTKFSHHLKGNIHAWWQRDGHRQVPPTQRWHVGVSQIGMGRERGISVWVRKLGTPPVAYPGPEWRNEEVFMIYPLPDRLAEPSAALASAAAIEFFLLRASTASAEKEQKR